MLDAFPYDYFSKKVINRAVSKIPEFKNKYSLKPSPGYENLPSAFSGLDSNNIDTLANYCFSPSQSNLRSFRFFAPILQKLPKQGLVRGISSRILRTLTHNQFIKHYGHLHFIPWNIIPYIDFSQKELLFGAKLYNSVPTLFYYLSKNNLSYEWLGYPIFKSDIAIVRSVKKKKRLANFTFIHISSLDAVSHKFGPNNKGTLLMALKVLEYTNEIILHVKKIHPGSKIILFSDHGMVDVTSYVNISRILQKCKLNIPHDVIPFYDSTMARFWCYNRKIKNKLINKIMENPFIKILDPQGCEMYQINPSEKYGHVITFLDPGKVFFPNYFNMSFETQGMHGYLEKTMQELAFLSTTDENKEFLIKNNVFLDSTNNIVWKTLFNIFQTFLFGERD